MRGLLVVAGSALLGLVVGYLAGVSYACSGDHPGNLCGLFGAFITGPIGCIAGVAIALKMLGRRTK